jgi:hypothetical protein
LACEASPFGGHDEKNSLYLAVIVPLLALHSLLRAVIIGETQTFDDPHN